MRAFLATVVGRSRLLAFRLHPGTARGSQHPDRHRHGPDPHQTSHRAHSANRIRRIPAGGDSDADHRGRKTSFRCPLLAGASNGTMSHL